MNTLGIIATSAIGSLLATWIIFIFIRVKWPRLYGAISGTKLFGHGVDFCFKNQATAERYMLENFDRSQEVKIFTMRGFSATEVGRPFRSLLEKRNRRVNLLLWDPGDSVSDNPYIGARVSEFPGGPSLEAYRRQLLSSIDNVQASMKANNLIQCRLHKQPALYRVFICDDVAYVSFFEPDKSGSQLPIIQVRRASPFYTGLCRSFNIVWNDPSTRDISALKVL